LSARLVDAGGDCHPLRRDVERVLAGDYRITHTTLQVDHVGPRPAAPDAIASLPPPDRHCDDSHGPVHRYEPHDH
jgi:cobalt-zinc-cadmium efflux system protein